MSDIKKLHDFSGGTFPSISICSICSCSGENLPQECPGFPVVEVLRKAIREGHLDYDKGHWFNPKKIAAQQELITKESNDKLVRAGSFLGIDLYVDSSLAPGEWIFLPAPDLTQPVIHEGRLHRREYQLVEKMVPVAPPAAFRGGKIK